MRRVDVERLAGQLEDLARLRARSSRSTCCDCAAKRAAVDADAGALDVDQHRDERQLEVAIDRVEPVVGEHGPAGRRAASEVGALAGVVERRPRRQRRRAHRLGALAADVFFGQRLVAECSSASSRAYGPDRSRRAGSWRASCRGRGRSSVTPCRASTIASNFRSWPIFSIAVFEHGADSQGLVGSSTVRAGLGHVQRSWRRPAGCRVAGVGRPRTYRGRRCPA